MKKALVLVAVLFMCGGTPLSVAASAGDDGFLCSVFGWAVKPIGWCVEKVEVTVVANDDKVLELVTYDNIQNKSLEEAKSSATVNYSTTTQPILEEITNEYITINQNGVSEEVLNKRLQEILLYINSLPHVTGLTGERIVTPSGSEIDTKEYILKSLDKVSGQISNSRDSLRTDGELERPTISDAVFTGTSYISGNLGIGTSSPSEILSVNGAIYLAETLPANSSNRLYNFGGDLYWNGSVVTSSTTGNWSASLGNAFRLNGNVGIGTSTPNDTLTVVGTINAGTTTARILDTGGQVCNVQAYGAVGDNSTDNYAAIMRAINACPEGGVVYFPMGEYRISQTIVLDKPITLRGSYSPRWSYSSSPRSSIRAAFGSFVGGSIIHVRDRTISGEVAHNNGGRIENISIDGGSWGTSIEGIYFEGLVRDWKLTDVDISQTTGNGFEAAVGAGSGNPRGFTIRGLSIYSADGHGFRATALNDSYLEDILVVGNALRGFYLSSMGETKVNNSRAVFNALEGLYIDGSSNNGGMMFTDFSTDRNDRHGVRISLTGTTSVTFNGLLTRRDGANVGGGTETPYAGVSVIGTTTAQVAPVFINGLTQIVGVDDAGAPPLAPLVGVRVANASYVKVEGQLWGVTNAFVDGGGNDNFIIEEDSIIKIGNVGVTETPPPLYNKKWVATSSGLIYDGQINIGSSTDNRLFNIVAPSGAGARFRDTTNNVTFDMRAEDFQGFFGTFSNHQLRFQTNNVSRMTIDTNGYIGMGTTSPDQRLDVIGTIQASNLLGGGTNLTTDVNGNIIRDPSDVRLKRNVLDVENALDKVLALRGVTYQWLDTDRFGDQVEMGFIAQEVDEVVPEVVRKGGDYWSLNTRNLLAVVVEAMQEIWETVTGNKQKIIELEERVVNLETLLDVEVDVDDEDSGGTDSDDSFEEVNISDNTATTSSSTTNASSTETLELPADEDENSATSTTPVEGGGEQGTEDSSEESELETSSETESLETETTEVDIPITQDETQL